MLKKIINWFENLTIKQIFIIFLAGVIFDLSTTFVGVFLLGYTELNPVSSFFFERLHLVGFFIILIYEISIFYLFAFGIKKVCLWDKNLAKKQNKRDISFIPLIVGVPGFFLIKFTAGVHNIIEILR